MRYLELKIPVQGAAKYNRYSMNADLMTFIGQKTVHVKVHART